MTVKRFECALVALFTVLISACDGDVRHWNQPADASGEGDTSAETADTESQPPLVCADEGDDLFLPSVFIQDHRGEMGGVDPRQLLSQGAEAIVEAHGWGVDSVYMTLWMDGGILVDFDTFGASRRFENSEFLRLGDRVFVRVLSNVDAGGLLEVVRTSDQRVIWAVCDDWTAQEECAGMGWRVEWVEGPTCAYEHPECGLGERSALRLEIDGTDDVALYPGEESGTEDGEPYRLSSHEAFMGDDDCQVLSAAIIRRP